LALAVAAALAGCGASGAATTAGGSQGPQRSVGAAKPPAGHPCPSEDRRKPTSRALAANVSLVPGHPEAVLLCRYGGLNGPRRYGLVSSRLITARSTVDRLARELNTLPKLPHGTMLSCPADFGTAVIAFFRYATGPSDPVTVELSGCGAVGNGHLTRLVAATTHSPVRAQLEALTPR
jgi:hypothetical protein